MHELKLAIVHLVLQVILRLVVTYNRRNFPSARKVSGEKSTILLLSRYLYVMISQALGYFCVISTVLDCTLQCNMRPHPFSSRSPRNCVRYKKKEGNSFKHGGIYRETIYYIFVFPISKFVYVGWQV